MIFVWRGRGLLGLIALFLPLASCAGLLDWNVQVASLAGSITLLIGGLVCRHYGRKWNQGSGFHMLYWMPLEIWGLVCIIVGALFSLLAVIGLVEHGVVR
jgi:hypothetical protein